MKNKATPKDIDAYIADFPADVQQILQEIRSTIQKAAPEAVETISYQMPAFELKGVLVYFAAYKNHIGFYPAPSGIDKFEKDLTKYKTGKGTLQFPLDKKMPFDLISKIVKFRVKENLEKAAIKAKKPKD